MDYPIWDLSLGGGVLIGIVAILHVVISHFAVGGGLLIAVVEARAVGRKDPALRALARRSSRMLILVSTVLGALTGVGIWFTIGLVHPAATGTLIRTFVWVWAAEWAFFLLEIVTALLYEATWDRVSPRTHLVIIGLYAFAAWMSLVLIQGILGFMLTPGRYPETRSLADAFFNPSYLPGLVLRSGLCLLLAGAWLTLAALREKDRQARGRAVRLLAGFQMAGAAIGAAGLLLWERSLPEEARRLFLGAKPLIASLGSTRSLFFLSLLLSAALLLAALVFPRLVNPLSAVVALLAGFAVLGSYERLREGARKPFVLRDQMFSNGVLVSEVDDLNRRGVLAKARWAATEPGQAVPASTGRAVFRAQCSSCHTLDGYLSIRRIAEAFDRDTLVLFLSALRDDGPKWKKRPPDPKPDYPFMPPFVGTDAEIEALATYLDSLKPQPAAEAAR